MLDEDDTPAAKPEPARINRGGTWRRNEDGTLTCIEHPTAPPGYIYDNDGKLQPIVQPAA